MGIAKRGAGRVVDAGRGHVVALLALSAMVAIGPAAGAAAQGAGREATTAQAAPAPVTFAIPPGPLSTALAALGRQARLQVTYDPAVVGDRQSPGLMGAYVPAEALGRLLTGTGLVYRFANPTTVTVESAKAGDGSMMLAPVTVEGQTETADGPVKGYVATRSAAGSKTDTPIVETPQSISVVTRDQMDARATETLIEALQYTPGVYTHIGGKDPRYDTFSLRGFGAQGTGNYRDGLRELGDANNFAHFRSEPYGLERIDVLRGPSSVLYGQNAPGGLVDVISKRPTADPIGEVVGLFATQERYQGAFDVGGAVDADKQFLFRLTGLARDADAQLAYFSDFVKDDRLYIAPAFTWQPTTDTKLTVLADFEHDLTGNAFPVSVATITGGAVTDATATRLFLGDPNWNKFEQDQFRVGYQLEHRLDEAVTLRQNLRYGQVDLDYRFLTGNLFAGQTTLSRVTRLVDENTSSFTVDNQIEGRLATGPLRHTLLAGLDHQRFDLDHKFWGGPAPSLSVVNPVYGQTIATPTTLLTSTDQQAKQLGLYVQDQIKLDNWVLTLGGRHDWADLDTLNRRTNAETKTDDRAFTKRFGLTYLFEMGLAPYFSYATSFLPTTGVDFFGDPFKPTTGQQYEAGLKYQVPGSDVLLTLAGFQLTQQNVLTADPALGHTGFSVQTGEIRARGAEAQAVASLAFGLDLTVSYTFQKLEITEGNSAELGKVPILTPRHMASAWADYTIQGGALAGLGFGAGVRYAGTTYKNSANTVQNDPYTVFDAALHYKWKGATVALNVSNVFDHEEALCSTSGGCQWISPRVIAGSIRYRW